MVDLVLALIVATTRFSDGTSLILNVLLQTFVITSSTIRKHPPLFFPSYMKVTPKDIVYTFCLITTAVITACALDGDVWVRDIDSSPSPFPVPILFAFLHNCLFARGKIRTSEQKNGCQINGEMPSQVPCSSPICGCPPKPACELQEPQHQDLELGRIDSTIKAKSLPLVLVRVPGAAERRTSIAISFGNV